MAQIKEDMAAEKQRIFDQAQREIAAAEEDAERRVQQTMAFFTLEINVANAIAERMIGDVKAKDEKLRKFATILRVPRLHFEYIDKHGVDEFVKYAEDIVRRERAMQE